MDEATLLRSTELLVEALQGGKHLTRSELFAHLEANGISTAGQRGVYMLQRAALERLIYQGPMQRNVTTFLLLGEGKTIPKDEAIAKLAGRYFTSHGPATLDDFTQWAALPISAARAGLASIKSELVEEQIEGQPYYFSPETPRKPARSLYLLPGFDEFVLGYRDRSAVLDAQFADAICPGGNGMFTPTIVSDGRIVGTWKRELKKNVVDITINAFRPLDADEVRLLEQAAAEFGTCLGLAAMIHH